MKTVHEPERNIPVLAETDVLVVGGGPAGMSAAIAAGRTGAKTMIIERHGCFGGVITQAMIGTIAWYRNSEKVVDAGGLLAEYEKKAEEAGAIWDERMGEFIMESGLLETPEAQAMGETGNPHSRTLDTELFKYIADQMLAEAKVTPLLHCLVTDVLKENGTISGVITESKSGRHAVLAKRVIDATGDGDVAARAGAPFREMGREEREGMSVNFGCSNVDLKKFLYYFITHPSSIADWDKESGNKENEVLKTFLIEPFRLAREAGEMPEDAKIESYWSAFAKTGEMPTMNAVFMPEFNALDVQDLTKAEQKGREFVMLALAALRKYTPGFQDAWLRSFGSYLGVRESRKINCEYELTMADCIGEATFDDTVAVCPEFLDGIDLAIMPSTGRNFQIPARQLFPRDVENLLVAGRCVGGDKNSHAAMRQMVACVATGQGAGVIAARSLIEDVPLQAVDITAAQSGRTACCTAYKSKTRLRGGVQSDRRHRRCRPALDTGVIPFREDWK